MAAQGCPNKTFETFGVPSKRPKSTKRAPKRPPGAPKRSPREPQNTLKGIFRSPNLIFLKSSSRRSEIKVFEAGRVSLGVQNRQEEAPRRGKQRLGRRGRANTGTKHTNIARKGQPKAFKFQGLRGTLTLLRRGFDVPSTGVIFAVDVPP